jgi:transcriptional regulator with XRE-family HTH domain
MKNKKESNLIKDILKDRGFTLSGLSKEIGISVSVFSQKLSGYRAFKLREVNFLCDKLDMTYEELFKNNDKVKTS